MRIAIATKYKFNDQSVAAISIANQCRKLGYETTIFTSGITNKNISKQWDHEVVVCKKLPPCDIFSKSDIVIWTDIPSPTQLIHAAGHGAKTVLYGIWDYISDADKDAFQLTDVVLTPILQSELLLRKKWKLPEVYFTPLDLGIPRTKKKPKSKGKVLNLLVPLNGSESDRAGSYSFDIISELLNKHVDITITLLTDKKFTKSTKQQIDNLKKKYNGRLIVIDTPSLDEQIILYGKADIVLKTGIADGSGFIYLMSVLMGTPIVMFDVAPLNEMPNFKAFAITVPCKTEYSKFGIPLAKPDPEVYIEVVSEMLDSRPLLNEIYQENLTDLEKHVKISYSGLDMAINGTKSTL